MTDLFDKILQDFYNAGAGWQILVIGIILLIKALAIIGVKNLIEIYRGYKTAHAFSFSAKAGKNCKKKQNDLFNHCLFFTMSHLINHKVKMMNFGDGNRNKIFGTLIEVKIRAIGKSSKELLEENDLCALDKNDFRALVFKNFSEIIDTYNLEMKDRFGEDIYGLVMQHPKKGFNAWHETVIVYTKNLIDDICDSDMYENNVERMFAILNAYHSAVDATLVNVEKTFHGFNGELDELIRNRTF